jgi:hypothetical protein
LIATYIMYRINDVKWYGWYENIKFIINLN